MNLLKNSSSGFLIAGIIIFFVFGSFVLEYALQNPNIWWTHRDFAKTADQTTDQVQILVKEEALQDVLADGRLYLEIEDEKVLLDNDDITFRFNNWFEYRAAQNEKVAIMSAGLTAGIIMLIIGLAPIVRKKNGQITE